MQQIVVEGGNVLNGEVRISGAKNAVADATATGVARDVNRARFESPIDFLAQARGPIGQGLVEMLAKRAANPAFHPDSPQRVWMPGPNTVAIERGTGPDHSLVAINFGAEPATVETGSASCVVGPYGRIWLENL